MRALALVASASAAAAVQTVETVKVEPADASTDARFGSAVAARGNRVLAGAPFKYELAAEAGAAYVFERGPSGWAQSAKLRAEDASEYDRFGRALALGDAVAAVGAPDSDATGQVGGAVYLFEPSGSEWPQTAKLVSPTGLAGDSFGTAVAIDGDTLLAGACFEDGNGASAGAAFVFVRDPTGWALEARLAGLDTDDGDVLGWSVALDGDRAIVGARFEDAGADATGAAYVFARTSPGGTSWAQVAKLVAADAAAEDQLGYAVALDGAYARVGAPQDDDAGANSGAAYVFRQVGSTWVQDAKLVPPDGAAGDGFGRAVSIAGGNALVGAWFDDDGASNAGSAYLYRRNGATWSLQTRLVASDGAANDLLGAAVSVDGGTAILGAYASDPSGTSSGAAYVYELPEPLVADVGLLSLATGGVQTMTLGAGAANAGAVHVLLGSLSGTQPGFPLDGFTLPLNIDAYTLATLTTPNAPPLAGSVGVLDATGAATATFTLPPLSPPLWSGLRVSHAYVVLRIEPTLVSVVLVSNDVALDLVP